MGGLKRIPRIKFPKRHSSGSTSENGGVLTNKDHQQVFMSGSDVPAPPLNTAVGGKASLQPKRTPVSEREIEAILVVASDSPRRKYYPGRKRPLEIPIIEPIVSV